MTTTLSNTFVSLASCRLERRCAVHAIVLDLPEPAECGVLPVLQGRLDHILGRRRSLSVEGLMVAMQINGLRRHHQATVAEFARVLNSFSSRQRFDLGIRNWDPKEAYDRADRLFNRLNHALEEGWDAIAAGSCVHIDANWVAQRL